MIKIDSTQNKTSQFTLTLYPYSFNTNYNKNFPSHPPCLCHHHHPFWYMVWKSITAHLLFNRRQKKKPTITYTHTHHNIKTLGKCIKNNFLHSKFCIQVSHFRILLRYLHQTIRWWQNRHFYIKYTCTIYS